MAHRLSALVPGLRKLLVVSMPLLLLHLHPAMLSAQGFTVRLCSLKQALHDFAYWDLVLQSKIHNSRHIFPHNVRIEWVVLDTQAVLQNNT